MEQKGSSGSSGRMATPGDTKKVLIVDDDRDIVKYLSLWFEDNGFMAQTAENGFEAMEQISSEKPDLITLDISMPEKSGVSALRELKTDPALKNIPVIISTGIDRMDKFLKKTRQAPEPEAFIAKPIDTEVLSKTVNRLLG